GSIYDSSFFFNPRLAKYRRPNNIHIPFWLTPARYYVGAAWYQKEINIPENWGHKRIIVHLERCHTETKLWINDQQIGLQNSLVAPHEYDVTPWLKPGRHMLTICVDNRIKEINVGPDSHSISDHTQGNWNGIIGNIMLLATPPVYLDELQVYPNVAGRQASIKIGVKNTANASVSSILKISATSYNTQRQHHTRTIHVPLALAPLADTLLPVVLPMGASMQTWDEFNPALYTLTATLQTGKEIYTKQVTFGMRSVQIMGNNFIVNGRRTFLRGTLHNGEFPLTGYPATDVPAWLRILKTAKAHGLNHIRFHSWCPPAAAFTAADLVGIYLMPEAPSWPNHGPRIGVGEPIDQYLYDETDRILKWYGNHPSFIMFSGGNEPAGNQVEYLNAFVQYWQQKDPRRVYTGMAVGGSWPVVPLAQFQVRGGIRGLAWDKQPESISNFSEPLSRFKVPFVAHEIGQYCAFPNFDEIKKYTGVYRAKNFELFQQDLADQGMAHQAKDFLMASGKLQALCYKHEIEKMLRTPSYAGFQMLGLQDFPGQGTALVGVLDAFWEPKGYITPVQFRRFCNTVVPLARFPKFVFTNQDTLQVGIEVFNAGPAPLKQAAVWWTIKDDNGTLIADGKIKPADIPLANANSMGNIQLSLHQITAPKQLNLEVGITGTSFVNDWDFWVYPRQQPALPPNVYYTTQFDEKALAVLNDGGKVFLNVAGQVVKGKEVSMHFLPVFWNTSWFKMKPPHVTGMLIQHKSGAFAQFPGTSHSTLQWWDIAHRAQVMVLEDFPAGFTPLVQPIDTWFLNRRLALIFEAKVGNGSMIVSSADLRPNTKGVAARQLFHSLIQYMASPNFKPSQTVSPALVTDILSIPTRQQFDPYTTDSPDELKPKQHP
ncbi:MAG TPA: glycoside hydrolase family 2 TIM barrel-domain containing protein, partial [Phnomibacter sp.]|nr:glycoside hydrolase family 2 TIM barrel-domain containing protein [Phnomibacter sp.]